MQATVLLTYQHVLGSRPEPPPQHSANKAASSSTSGGDKLLQRPQGLPRVGAEPTETAALALYPLQPERGQILGRLLEPFLL